MRTNRVSAAVVLLGLAGCADVIGLGTYEATGAGGTGGGATGGTTSSGGGGSTSAGGGGDGGSGGTGGTTATPVCEPGTTEACYDAPAVTLGVGPCKAGERTCDDAGQWGACAGQVVPAFESCTTTDVDESCDSIATCTGAYRWARRFGSALDQIPTKVAADAEGNLVVAGHAAGELDFGLGPLPDGGGVDGFVVKLDRDGKPLWNKRFGDAGDQHVRDLALDGAGNVFLVGSLAGTASIDGHVLTSAGEADVFVAKLAPDGAHLWSRVFGTAALEDGTAVAVDPAGDVLVGGTYTTTLSLGGPDLPPGAAGNPGDIFVAKLDGDDGAHLWSKGYPAANTQLLPALATDAQGDVVVLAYGGPGVDFGGGPLAIGMGDVFAAKLTGAAGAHVWSHVYGGTASELAFDVAVTPGGGAVFIGHSASPDADFGAAAATAPAGLLDLYVWKVAPDGTTEWVVRDGDETDQFGAAVAVDAEGNVLFAGSFNGASTFPGVTPAASGIQRLLGKLTPAGVPLWVRQFQSGAGLDVALTTDAVGNVLYAGGVFGPTDFGGGPLTGVAGDIVVATFAP